MSEWLTKPDVEAFAKSLSGVYGEDMFERVYKWAGLEARDNPDTLSPEFQLAAEICDLYARHCQRYQPDKRWMRDDLNDDWERKR